MKTLIHHSPLGPLEIPGVIGRPEPGEPFAVDDDIAAELLTQTDLYSAGEDAELTIPELKQLTREQGVDIKGLRRKEDIAAAIENANTVDQPATVAEHANPAEQLAPTEPVNDPSVVEPTADTDAPEGDEQ